MLELVIMPESFLFQFTECLINEKKQDYSELSTNNTFRSF